MGGEKRGLELFPPQSLIDWTNLSSPPALYLAQVCAMEGVGLANFSNDCEIPRNWINDAVYQAFSYISQIYKSLFSARKVYFLNRKTWTIIENNEIYIYSRLRYKSLFSTVPSFLPSELPCPDMLAFMWKYFNLEKLSLPLSEKLFSDPKEKKTKKYPNSFFPLPAWDLI